MIYLDNAATTQLDDDVLNEMLPFLEEEYGNPDTFCVVGETAADGVTHARERVANAIGAAAPEIHFTSGGTEANNWILLSQGRLGFWNIITSKIEHHSITKPFEFVTALTDECDGWYVDVDKSGRVGVESIVTTIGELRSHSSKPILVSVMMVNNETGTVQPVTEIVQACKTFKDVYVHTDATQALGKIDTSVEILGVDYMTLSSHKVHGPKGVGALYVRNGAPIEPMMFGGNQETNLRPGTTNVAGVVGFGKAAELAHLYFKQERMRDLETLTGRFYLQLKACLNHIRLNGSPEHRTPNIININVGVDCHTLMLKADELGVCVACGSACTSGDETPSHVLTSMGLTEDEAMSSVRISTSRFTTELDVSRSVRSLAQVIQSLRKDGV